MKKIVLFLSLIFFTACSSGNKNVNLVKVGYIGESDRVILEEVIRQVSNDNIQIELVSFGDYLLPNQALNDGDIDLNNFQHYAFLIMKLKLKDIN